MNLGHSCETSREIFAYPYPGRSAKISSGRGFPGQRISKKLMLRVRPGVELVRASLVPTSELMTLDFPTFERPRKAISGTEGTGKWDTSVAAARNCDRTLITKFAMEVEGLASWARSSSSSSAQAMKKPRLPGRGAVILAQRMRLIALTYAVTGPPSRTCPYRKG